MRRARFLSSGFLLILPWLVAACAPPEQEARHPARFMIDTHALLSGKAESPYSAILRASNGTPPYTWSVAGTLPDGIVFDEERGTLSGTPDQAQSATLTFTVTDAGQQQASQAFTLEIAAPGEPWFTGVAVTGTDVWYIDVDSDMDDDTVGDFNEVLIARGWLDERDTIIEEILEMMFEAYGNNADGSLNFDTGIPISFTTVEPPEMQEYPGTHGAPRRGCYNIIQLVDADITPTFAGHMFLDNRNREMENTRRYNRNRSSDDLLGVYPRALNSSSAVFKRTLAITICHEIGHALGLPHPATNQGFIMDTHVFSSTTPEFSAEDYADLLDFMPGTKR